jgi:hypothetical protein
MVVIVEQPIPEINAQPGDRLHIDPSAYPEIVVSRAEPMPVGQLYGWLLGKLNDEAVTLLQRRDVSDLVAYLQTAVGASEAGTLPSPVLPPDPPLVLLK